MRFNVPCLALLTLALALPFSGSSAQTDPLSGTWTGDWGPSEYDRNEVTVVLRWDGSSLMGTVNPGPNAVELLNASFDPATRTVRMEAQAPSVRGMVHYNIEGILERTTIRGSWNHANRSGDFAIVKAE